MHSRVRGGEGGIKAGRNALTCAKSRDVERGGGKDKEDVEGTHIRASRPIDTPLLPLLNPGLEVGLLHYLLV